LAEHCGALFHIATLDLLSVHHSKQPEVAVCEWNEGGDDRGSSGWAIHQLAHQLCVEACDWEIRERKIEVRKGHFNWEKREQKRREKFCNSFVIFKLDQPELHSMIRSSFSVEEDYIVF